MNYSIWSRIINFSNNCESFKLEILNVLLCGATTQSLRANGWSGTLIVSCAWPKHLGLPLITICLHERLLRFVCISMINHTWFPEEQNQGLRSFLYENKVGCTVHHKFSYTATPTYLPLKKIQNLQNNIKNGGIKID